MDTFCPSIDAAIVRLGHTFAARRERVFQAWTNPDEVRAWFGQRDVAVTAAAIDLRVGGNYIFSMRTAGGTVAHNHGIYREVVPPERLVFTWQLSTRQSDGTTPSSGESLVTVALREHAGTTELVLTHDLPATDRVRASTIQGWTGGLEKLAMFLTSEGRLL